MSVANSTSRLTPTSYALLGLLAVRPWSAYELTRYMRTSAVAGVWPRAESKLYEEPRKLEAEGLVSSKREPRDGRPRTVYRITRKGRSALRKWLKEPGAGPKIEFEAALKVVHSGCGAPEDLHAHLENIRRLARDERRGMESMVREIVERGPAIPERAHTNALLARLGIEMMRTAERWAQWALEASAEWSETPDAHASDAHASDTQAILRKILAEAGDD